MSKKKVGKISIYRKRFVTSHIIFRFKRTPYNILYRTIMELTGKIIAVLPERSGVSARTGSEWRCASYVIETLEQYPRKMNFDVFGVDRIQQFNIQLGETMVVSFDIDAHEYQGRWFNSIRAWKVDRNLQAAAQTGASVVPDAPFAAAPSMSAPFPPMSAAPTAPATSADNSLMAGDGGDDLPF